jgi:hypothetical protein
VLLSSAFAYFPLVSDMAFVPGRKHDLFLSYAHIEAASAECFRKALCDEFQVRRGTGDDLAGHLSPAIGTKVGIRNRGGHTKRRRVSGDCIAELFEVTVVRARTRNRP